VAGTCPPLLRRRGDLPHQLVEPRAFDQLRVDAELAKGLVRVRKLPDHHVQDDRRARNQRGRVLVVGLQRFYLSRAEGAEIEHRDDPSRHVPFRGVALHAGAQAGDEGLEGRRIEDGAARRKPLSRIRTSIGGQDVVGQAIEQAAAFEQAGHAIPHGDVVGDGRLQHARLENAAAELLLVGSDAIADGPDVLVPEEPARGVCEDRLRRDGIGIRPPGSRQRGELGSNRARATHHDPPRAAFLRASQRDEVFEDPQVLVRPGVSLEDGVDEAFDLPRVLLREARQLRSKLGNRSLGQDLPRLRGDLVEDSIDAPQALVKARLAGALIEGLKLEQNGAPLLERRLQLRGVYGVGQDALRGAQRREAPGPLPNLQIELRAL